MKIYVLLNDQRLLRKRLCNDRMLRSTKTLQARYSMKCEKSIDEGKIGNERPHPPDGGQNVYMRCILIEEGGA